MSNAAVRRAVWQGTVTRLGWKERKETMQKVCGVAISVQDDMLCTVSLEGS